MATTGQLFLAYMPRTITQPLLKNEDTSKIQSLASIDGAYKDVSNLESLIGAVRKQGHASMEGHLVPGVWSASAPVFDSQGEIVAGLTIVGNATDGEPERATATKKLKAIAAESSATLGWAGG